MRHLRFIVIIGISLSISCSKPHSNSKTGEQSYIVNYHVTLNQEFVDPEPGKVNTIYYNVFTTDGKYVHGAMREDFNGELTFADTLASGTYNVLITAGKTGLLCQHNAPAGFGEILFYENYSYPQSDRDKGINRGFHDTYAQKLTVQIPSVSTRQVVLNRAPALLSINIEDAMPADADSIFVNVDKDNYIYESGYLSSDTAAWDQYTLKIGKPVPDSLRLKTNGKLQFYVINTTRPVNVHMWCKNKSGKVTGDVSLNNPVSLQQGKITSLTGKLFSNDNTLHLK